MVSQLPVLSGFSSPCSPSPAQQPHAPCSALLLQGEAAAMGMSSKAFAFYLDRQKEERALARTVFCNTTEMSTEKFHYTIIDAPGGWLSCLLGDRLGFCEVIL